MQHALDHSIRPNCLWHRRRNIGTYFYAASYSDISRDWVILRLSEALFKFRRSGNLQVARD